MATSCCGVKKQKLNNAIVNTSSTTAPNSSSSMNSYGNCTSNNHHSGTGGMSNGLPGGSASRSNGICAGNSMSASMIITSVTDKQMVNGARQQRVVNMDMVIYCFDVLYSYLQNTDPPKTPKFTNDHFPLFVTWKLGKDKKLRGCIGTFNSTSLHQGLREYAITSACKDSRFDPICTDEFARLHCSVSLLMDFEVAEHYLDWEIGVHGIRIEFNTEKGSKKAATYLPEVAVEQGWNQIQTIDSLMRKGGYKGNITAEIRSTLCLVRFQSEKITGSYHEYMAHKQHGSSPSNHYLHRASDDSGFPSKLISNGTVDMELHDHGGASGTGLASSYGRHYHNHHGQSSSCTSMMNGGGMNHQQPRMASTNTNNSSSGGNRHAFSRHRSSSSGGRYSPTSQKDSHHPSANASRYLPLPSHPYMPPPPPNDD